MSQINPKIIIKKGIVISSEFTEIQQVGIDLTISEEVLIQHGKSINILFNEKIKLPKNMYATFYQRSSFSRKGIFMTTGIYDPSYQGSLGCTIYNMSGDEVSIPKNHRIGQILCFKAEAAGKYKGQFQGK